MLNTNLVADTLTAALSVAGDMAEIFVENSERSTINMINGQVDKANWGIDYGCGIRIICGHNAIYAYTNRLDADNLIKVAKEASVAAEQLVKATSTTDNARLPATIPLQRLFWDEIHTVSILPSDGEKKNIVNLLRSASAASYGYDKLITQTSGSYASVIQDVLIANSKGLLAEDRRVRTRVSITAVASGDGIDGHEKQTGRHSPGASKGLELFDDFDIEHLAKDAAKTDRMSVV